MPKFDYLTVSIESTTQAQRKNFSCGVDDLDFFLQRYAKRNHKKGSGKTFVFLEDEAITGYYTISMGSIDFENLPEKLNLPKYPIPVARIGRLAVSKESQRKGLGKALLIDALNRVYHASESVAAYAIVVEAKDEKAKAFYEHHEFIPYKDALSLYLPMATVTALLANK